MIFRNKRFITLAICCHLILAATLLTKRLQAQDLPSSPAASMADSTGNSGEPVTIKAREQEKKGDVYSLRGDVEIEYRDYTIKADEITYDAETGKVTANGHFSTDGGAHDEHIEASHGTYNVRTQKGEFFDVAGTTGVRFQGKNVTLTTDEPFAFTGKRVEKTSRDQFIVYEGTVTSCELPNPKWTFNAARVVVNVGGTAKIYNGTFRIKKIPVFFFPFADHPVTKIGRQSGFLVPTFGTSSRKGTIVGESFYWAINRSMDATAGAEYYSSRGWAEHGTFRAKPSQHSFIDATYFQVLDRGYGPQDTKQGGEEVKVNAEAELPRGTLGVASIDYLSSYVFRQAFTETFTQAVNSEVKSQIFFSKGNNGFFFNALGSRYQNFQSTTPGDVITVLRAPSFEIDSVDERIGRSPLYYALAGSAEGVSRRSPSFKTNDLVGRFDVSPSLSLPLFFRGWTFRPEIGMQNTYYTQRNSGTPGVGTPLNDPINRRAIGATLEMRPPTLGRIFEKTIFGRKVKHTIEPIVAYRIVNGVSGFRNVIRFDSSDILSDTSEIQYGVIQRLFLKKSSSDCGDPPQKACEGPREFVTWELANRYYLDPTFGGALVPGKRNVLTTTVDFSGIAFLTEPRNFSPIMSKIRIRATNNIDASWEINYDTTQGRINSSTMFVNFRLGDFFAGGSEAFFLAPGELFVTNPMPAPTEFNQFRVLLGYGGPNKRGISAAASVGFDEENGFLQYGSFQSSYNWNCCGISAEYRRFALGSVRNENQYRFAFTLANIGTFGNLKRQEKLF